MEFVKKNLEIVKIPINASQLTEHLIHKVPSWKFQTQKTLDILIVNEIFELHATLMYCKLEVENLYYCKPTW